MAEKVERYSADPSGNQWTFRRVAVALEMRQRGFSTWQVVCEGHFVRFSPAQLRHIADVLEEPANV